MLKNILMAALIVMVSGLFGVFFAIMWAKSTGINLGISSQKIVHLDDIAFREISGNEEFKVMSWNISFAFGVGSEGAEGYRQLEKDEYQDKFKKLVDVIKNEDADILLLQEVDFESKRSHSQDQALAIAKECGYSYIAYAISWDHNYIPFPGGFSRHFGKVNSGGAILSKFKIVKNEVELFEKPSENPFWYNWFYLYRYSQIVTLDIGDKEYDIINSHLEAFNKKARLDQIKKMANLAKKNNRLLLFGGDFNTTPTYAAKKASFSDYPDDDYDKDGAYEQLKVVGQMQDIVGETEYLENEKSWFTFPSTSPDRKLDYIFVSENVDIKSKKIIQSESSDHLPIVTTLELSQL